MNKLVNLCLNYHDFSGTSAKSIDSLYTVDFNQFKNQMNLLSGFKNVNVIDLIKSDNPPFTISMTFDDGCKSNLYIAEELAKRELSGTFFIIKDKCLHDSTYLSKQEVRELNNLGMNVGSHSTSHRHMNRLTLEDMKTELRDSKHFLEDLLGKKVDTIAYPGGHCGPREFKIAKEEGYLINRTTITGINKLPLNNGIVKCMTIKNDIDMNTFEQIINLSPLYFGKIKLREIALYLPKLMHSKYRFNLQKK